MPRKLDNIREKEYTTETCDGRGKTRREAAARLTRVVCADIDMLNDQDIVDMAQFVYDQQVDQITRSLKQVSERIRTLTQERIRIVVTGLGRNFLARKAAEKAGFNPHIWDVRGVLPPHRGTPGAIRTHNLRIRSPPVNLSQTPNQHILPPKNPTTRHSTMTNQPVHSLGTIAKGWFIARLTQ